MGRPWMWSCCLWREGVRALGARCHVTSFSELAVSDCARALEHLKMLEFQNLDLNLSPFWAKAQTSKPCVESRSLYVFLSVARFSCWETLAA